MKLVKFSTILMALLLSIVPVLAQSNTDRAPNEPLDGFPPAVPSMFVAVNQPPAEMPSDFAPAGQVCDHAADSYLSAGMEVSHVEMVNFDDIIYNNSDEAVILTALYNHLLPDLAAFEKSAVMLNDQNVLEPSNSVPQDTFFVGQDSICVNTEGMTVRLWETVYGYVVESVRFNDTLDMAQFWGGVGENVNPNNPPFPNNLQLNAPEFPVMVDGVTVRFLLPYVTMPPAVGIGGDTINNNVYPTPCEYGAPSYLGVGLEVEMGGHGYEEFPSNYGNDYLQWDFQGTQLALGDFGWGRYADFLNTTPLVSIPGNFEAILQSPEELYGGFVAPSGTIVDGPVCSSHYDYHSNDDIIEAGGDGHHFVTWWQVELDGITGWYPESTALYAYGYGLTFGRRVTGYYMRPVLQTAMVGDTNTLDLTNGNTATTGIFIRIEGHDGESNDAAAIECLPTRFVDGATVEPAQRLNLRIEPNGAVIGAVEAGEQVMLIGSPVSESGYLWWYTSRGGWIAEYDCETNVALLLPAVQNAVPETSSNDTNTIDPTVTAEPERPTEQPTLAPITIATERPTDSSAPPRATEAPPRATCDPATGAGC